MTQQEYRRLELEWHQHLMAEQESQHIVREKANRESQQLPKTVVPPKKEERKKSKGRKGKSSLEEENTLDNKFEESRD